MAKRGRGGQLGHARPQIAHQRHQCLLTWRGPGYDRPRAMQIDAARSEILAQLDELLGNAGATAVAGLLKSVDMSDKGPLGTVIGVVLLLIGATSVFGELQYALDRVWKAGPSPHAGAWQLVRARLLSAGLILSVGFLLMVSLVGGAALAALGRWSGERFEAWRLAAEIINVAFGFVLTVGLFAFIYKVLPRVRLAWRDVWIGSLVTAALFTVGKTLIGWYIGRSGIASGFGAASSIVIVLLWVYYSAQIFLAGAEFTRVFANRYGSRRGDASIVMPHGNGPR